MVQVLEEVDARLSGYGDIEVAVLVEVERKDLGAYASGSVDGDGYAGEGGGALAVGSVVGLMR